MFEKVRDRKTIDKMVEVSLDDLVRFAYYHVGNRTDAEDIVYEAILRLLEKVARDLVPDKVRGYLFRIVYNLCRDHFRHRNAPSVSFEAINLPNLPDDVLDNEEVDRVNGLLDGLPSRELEVIRMNVIDGLSFVEISQILSIPQSTAKSRFNSGMEKLRKQYFTKKPL